MKSFAFATLAVAVAAGGDGGFDGPIAPESFGYAVNDWDINEPTIDDGCYEHQVDIFSDQLVAIEATRFLLTKLIRRVERAE